MKSRVSLRLTCVLCLAALFVLIAAGGCTSPRAQELPVGSGTTGSQETTPADQNSATTSTPQEANLYTPTYVPNGDEVAVIKTNKGTITVELYGKEAPLSVGNFIELAQKGFYDDLKFHRLEPGFVIQGGDPQTKELSADKVKELVAKQKSGAYAQGEPMIGTGGPGHMIKGEFDLKSNPHKHVDGSLAMARSQSPDSAGSQFYFTLGVQSFLDGSYTVFGQTTGGLDVVHKLGVGDIIESVTIENASK